LIENIEYKGVWWLPEKPDNKIPGTLTYASRERIKLELQGSLSDKFDFMTAFQASVILGVSNSGEEITLVDCHAISGQVSFLGNSPSSSTLVAISLLIGAHFETEDDIRLETLLIHYFNLDEWVNMSGFNETFDESKSYTIKYERPKKIEFQTDEYEMAIEIGWSISHHRKISTTISQKARLIINSKQLIELKKCFTLIRKFQDFFTLAIGKTTYPTEIIGLINRAQYEPIKIIYALPRWPSEAKELHSVEMLFTLPTITDKLSSLFNNWLNKSDSLQPVYALYFATLYNSQVYMDASFLNFAQALETYHRRTYGGKYQTDNEFREDLYQKLVSVLPDNLESSFKESLKHGKLYYANEYSLRKRLQELTNRFSGKIPLNFIEGKKQKEFIEDVSNTRNYLTHYDIELESKAVKGRELYKLRQKLKLIIEICLLEELGFDLDSISQMLQKRREYDEFRTS